MTTPPPPGKGPGKGGPLDIFKRKPAAAVAVGGAGLVVLVALMKRGGGGAGAADSGATSTTSGGGATYDSTANDVYNSIETQFNAFQGQLDQLQQQLAGHSGTGTTSGGSTTKQPLPITVHKPVTPPKTPAPPRGPVIKPPSAYKPGGVTKPAAKPKTVTVQHGQTLSGIAKSNGISFATLKRLNPVYWRVAKYHNGNSIVSGDKVRIR